MTVRVAGLTLVVVALAGALLVAGSGRALSQGTNGGVTVTVSPLSGNELTVEIVAIEPGGDIPEVPAGTKLRLTVEMTNIGKERLRRGEVTLFFDHSGLRVVGPETRNFGALNVGQTKRVRWDIHADEIGIYVITTVASATLGRTGPLVSGKDSETITILEATPLSDIRIVGVDPAGDISAGSRFRITATVANLGVEPLTDVTVTLHFDTSGLSLSGGATHRVASLDAGRAEQHRWDVRADEAGLYAITVEVIATADLDDPAVVNGAPTVTVTVVEPAGPGTADGTPQANVIAERLKGLTGPR